MNALMLATTDVGCKNLFCYAENNPVTNKDGSGNFVDTIFDVISLAGSIADVCKKPNDPMAWACLAGDAMDVLIPGVAGIGEVIRGAKTVAIAAGAAEAAVGVAKGATKLSKKIDNLVDATKSLGKKAAKTSTQITGTSYDINKLVKTQSYVDNSVVTGMKDSILKNGSSAVPPISVRVHHGEALVVQGHHRLEAFIQLGYERVPINYVHQSQLGKIQKDGDYYRTIEELLAGRVYN